MSLRPRKANQEECSSYLEHLEEIDAAHSEDDLVRPQLVSPHGDGDVGEHVLVQEVGQTVQEGGLVVVPSQDELLLGGGGVSTRRAGHGQCVCDKEKAMPTPAHPYYCPAGLFLSFLEKGTGARKISVVIDLCKISPSQLAYDLLHRNWAQYLKSFIQCFIIDLIDLKTASVICLVVPAL
nr:unnamed protein product [Callosobruchus analis]